MRESGGIGTRKVSEIRLLLEVKEMSKDVFCTRVLRFGRGNSHFDQNGCLSFREAEGAARNYLKQWSINVRGNQELSSD